MQLEDAAVFTKKCFKGELPSCSNACPFHLDVRALMDKAGRGKWNTAYKTYRKDVIFPSVVAALCPQPCLQHCQRTVTGDEPIAIRDIEAACVAYAKNKKADTYAIPPKDKKIAVIGAGPAGLACALDLANKKYPVTVYDKAEGWGGHLRTNPVFEQFDEDFRLQFAAAKVDFRFNTEVRALEELEPYDAAYIATGKDGDAFGLLPSWEPDLETTSQPGVFLGGELCGRGEVESIAAATRTARTIEGFVQTGRAEHGHDAYAGCEHILPHKGAKSVPRVKMSAPDGYTADEAVQEAARCLQCDCNLCYDECELLQSTSKNPRKMAVEVYTDSNANPPIATHELTRFTYSCNNCGHCKQICPEHADVGGLLHFSREDRFGTKNEPKALHWFWLREMDFATKEASYAAPPKGKNTCEYAFFPGCQLGASNPEHVLRSYDFLSENFSTGVILGCCGAPAYWAGDKARRTNNSETILKQWQDLGEPTLVFACATCMNIFEQFLPQIPRVSLYELLDKAGYEPEGKPFADAAVFDPCAAREDETAQNAVRSLGAKAGITMNELNHRGRCCGYGGQMRISNQNLYDKIVDNRIADTDLPYIVWCANCREVFAGREKDCAHVLDIMYGLESGGVPSFEQKRKNSLKVKDTLMRNLTGEGFRVEKQPWDDVQLTISDEMQEKMDYRLITAADVRETIWRSNESGEQFVDPERGTVLCRMVTDMLTYWVEYRKTSDVYEIQDAYTHRMHFKEGV